MTHRRRKVAVIGLDGATFTILDPLFEAGLMPNLRSLMREGIRGELKSVVPTNSAAAWASFMTGKNPGKHGVFEFRMRSQEDFWRYRIVSSRHIGAETLWDIANRCEKRVVVVNLPLTYPPQEVKGCMVTGMDTPTTRHTFTYPPDLGEELMKAVGEYMITVPWMHYQDRVEGFLRDLGRMTRARTAAILYLMERQEFDLLMAVYVSPDRLQHCLWRYLDPEYPGYDPARASRYLPLIQDFFTALDADIGRILERLEGGTSVLVISDHGFQAADKQLALDEWLAQKGLLVFEEEGGSRKLDRLKRIDHPLIRSLRRLYRHRALERIRAAHHRAPNILWARTKAYSSLEHQQGISVNLVGREPQGIVQPGHEFQEVIDLLREELLSWRESTTGEKVVREVLTREEAIPGFSQRWAPDLLIVPARNFHVAPFSGRNLLFRNTGWASGGHSPEGILIAGGAPFKKGGIEGAKIVDLLPTILYLLGLEIPDDLDGRVLEEIFDESYWKANPPRYRAMETPRERVSEEGLTAEEEEAVKERLRGLGYLG